MIILKSEREIKIMRESNRIVAEVLSELEKRVGPGVTTRELDREAEELIRKRGGEPAFLGYRGYPFTICASVNEEVVHAFPSRRKLKEGDIISIDVGALYDGYYGDAAVTLPVGQIGDLPRRLIDVTREALSTAIEKVRVGSQLNEVSGAIQDRVESQGFSVVRDFVGHGIGKDLHESPQIANYRMEGGDSRVRLKAGMVLALEPMVNAGTSEVEILPDGWTAVTQDRSLSAHFEHSVAVTENGPLILSVL